MVVTNLVSEPEEVKISYVKTAQLDVFEIRVQKKDRGKIIGKQGSMAKALRLLVVSLCAKHDLRGILEICD